MTTTRKRTPGPLTVRRCKAARHSGTSYPGRSGKPVFRREVLWDSEPTGLGLRLLPSGRKSWVLFYRHRGKQRLAQLGDFGVFTLDQARKRARAALVRRAEGVEPFARQEDGKRLASFGDDFAAELQERVETGALRASTASKYREGFAALKEVIGGCLLDELDEAAVRRAFGSITKTRGRYAANRSLGVLRLVVELAGQNGYRERHAPDPTADIERHRETRRGRELTAEELSRLGAALSQEEARRPEAWDTVAAIRLLALTGCRRREITGLRWGEVDFTGMRLRLATTKTGPREAALSTAAAAILEDLRERSACREPEARVFPPVRHEPGFAIQYTWRKVREAAGLPPEARLHDLRHTYVTRGISANFSEALVGRAVGHLSLATTRRYSHLGMEPVRQVVERVSAEVAAALSGEPAATVVTINPAKR